MSINISPEELLEHSKNIVKHVNRIRELTQQIEDAKNSLSEWQSSNKDAFVSKMDTGISKMVKMADAAESYGLVGSDVASRVLGVENNIRETLLKSDTYNAN